MSYDRKFTIRWFFNEMIKTSHTTIMMEEAIVGGGYPLSGLIDSLLTSDGGCLIDKMINNDTDESHEFRLNDAGLKLYWRLDRKHGLLKVSIGGDQANNYPKFVAAVRRLIEHNIYMG